jgi:hypothetical protein
MIIQFDRFEGTSFDTEFVGTIRIKIEHIEDGLFWLHNGLRKDLYQTFGEELFKQILDSGSKNSQHFEKLMKAFNESIEERTYD